MPVDRQGLVVLMEGFAVAKGFLGRGIGMVIAILGMLKEQIHGGDDALDL